ncbi:MAG TPA: hypothetical protein VEL06_12295 [Haliangiales bacterium]|nr:hypothetical protein [Haliangiales bacterium]
MSDPTPPASAPPPPKRRGCFFYGCITVLVIMVFFGVAGFIAFRYVLNRFIAVAEQYTDTKPMTLPKVELSAADYEQLNKRVTAFGDGLNGPEAVPPLVLSGEEINALIANDPNWKQMKGKAYVTVEGDQIKGQVSVPLAEFAGRVPGLSRLKGRYLNGSAALKVSLSNGQLVVTLRSLEAKGQSPPQQVMTQLQTVNFAQDASQNPKTAELIGKLESIEVKDGEVIIKARTKK